MRGIIAAVLSLAGLIPGAQAPLPDEAAPRSIVMFDRLPDDALARLRRAGVDRANLLRSADAAVIEASGPVLATVASWSDVVDVHPDRELDLHMWQANENTRVDEVRVGVKPLRTKYTGEGVTVAVLDSGVEDIHPDLNNRVALHLATTSAFGKVTEMPSGVDPLDHGTKIAGIVGGAGRAAQGDDDMRGVAPDATLIDLNLTVEAAAVPGPVSYESTMVLGIDWVLAHRNDDRFPGGIRVLVSGTGTPGEVPAIRKALRRVIAAGITVVFPIGNTNGNAGIDGNPEQVYPARYTEVLGIGGVCKRQDDWSGFCADDRLWHASATGPAVDVVAPSVDVWTTSSLGAGRWGSFLPTYTGPVPGQGDVAAELNNRLFYLWSISTSFAAAQVAGVVALMIDANPSISPADVHAILTKTAHDMGTKGADERFGHGLVDAVRAVDMAERY